MRRIFLAAIAVLGCVGLASAKPAMRIGFVTDTHVGASYERCWKLKKTIELFRREKCDIIVNGGDIADVNRPESYAAIRRIYDETFAGQTPPAEIFAYAWHDVYLWKDHPRAQVNADAAACWPDLKERLRIPHHHTDRIVHRGYAFLVFPQWLTGKDGFPSYEDYEKAIASACRENPGKPVFVVDHVPPRGTVPGSDKWGDARRRAVLDRYPQVVVLAGHTHGDVCDERLLWQGAFTVVNAGCQHYWSDGAEGAAPTNRPAFSALTIDVFPDGLTIRRFDVREGKEVARPWRVTRPPEVTRVYFAGDSLVDANAYRIPGRGSWAESLRPHLAKGYDIVNLGVGGTSSRTYRATKRWDRFRAEARRGDWLVLAFGRNDASTREDSKTTAEEYLTNLVAFVEEAKGLGVRPVVVTPVSDAFFSKDGRHVGHLQCSRHAAALRGLAAERGYAVVDLDALTSELLKSLGPEKSRPLYMVSVDGRDVTHLTKAGAERVADMFCREAVSAGLPFIRGASSGEDGRGR